MASSATEYAQPVLELWSLMELMAASAPMVKFFKEASVLASAETTRFWIVMEIATPVVPTKSSPTADVSALLDTH